MCTKWAYKRSAPGSVHLQYLIPNFEWGKLIGRHINLLSLLRGNKLYPPTLPPTPLPNTHLHQYHQIRKSISSTITHFIKMKSWERGYAWFPSTHVLQIWVYSGFLYLFVLVRKENRNNYLNNSEWWGKKRSPSFTKGAAWPAYCTSPEWNISAQRCHDLLSCTSRKHCRIAPYRSLILNVPVFSQLLKFVCRMIFTLWDVKCTFSAFTSPCPPNNHLINLKVNHCSSLWTFLIVFSWNKKIWFQLTRESRDTRCFVMISCSKVMIK